MRKVSEAQGTDGLRGRWLILDYAQSFAWRPVRPMLRVWRSNGARHDAILPAAIFGRGRWVGLMPGDLIRYEIWAALPDAALFRMERISSVPNWLMRLRLAAKHPFAFLKEIVPGLIRTTRGRVNNVRMALLQEPPSRVDRFARARSRPLEAGSFDPVSSPEVAPKIGFLLLVRGEGDDVAPTLASLGRQADPHWSLTVFAETAESAARIEDQAKLAGLTERVAVRLGGMAGLPGWLDGAGSLWLGWLSPGDRLPDWAVLALRSEIGARPGLALLTTDSATAGAAGELSAVRLEAGWCPEFLLSGREPEGLCLVEAGVARSLAAGLDPEDVSFSRRMLLRAADRLRGDRTGHLARVAVQHDPSRKRQVRDLDILPAVEAHLAETSPECRIVASHGRVQVSYPPGSEAVAIVMPTRDRLDLLRPAVESVLARTVHPAFELIVADNDSGESATLDYLTALQQRPGLRVLQVPGAFNFSRIVNMAVAQVEADIVVLLNNDTEVLEPGWLTELVSLARRPGTGAVGAKLLYPDGRIQHAGVVVGWGGYAGHFGRLMPDGALDHLGRGASRHQVSAVTAACLAVSRANFVAVGGFDESFAVAFNDVDFCLRLQARGLRNIYTPHAVLRHRESASRGLDRGSKRARFLAERERFGELWREVLQADPHFQLALSLNRNDERLE
ncbi:glycosyltransferase family 2 protein [uncultured Enterovirga sp.]|uniref:glycosyltransferase family 2 protein n=1 Tax=uncultured Enterovirga sp. TaxID=2026352 RepID=UPI0035CACAA3